MDKELDKKLHIGLTKEEVAQKAAQGLVNGEMDVKTKSYSQIFKDNICTLFNLVNTILVACIIYVQSWKNGLFFFVVIFNAAIGIFQEIRAKKTIEELTLLSAPKANVLRDGRFEAIPVKDIVAGEIMQLKNGSQISADAVVLDGECQVNESLITGESTPIPKKKGDHLLSGSFLISGKVIAEAEHIGNENYVNKITLGAKYYKKQTSVIMRSVKSIVRVIAIAIIPLAALFIWNNFFRVDQDFTSAMVKTVAAVASMIPGGLVLLVSMVLAVSVIRLAMHRTLAQDLYCVENLARVDVLCLDKTGTITEGVMAVEEILPLAETAGDGDGSRQNRATGNRSLQGIEEAIRLFACSIDDENPTINAIRSHFLMTDEDVATALRQLPEEVWAIPFSSDKKWSLVRLEQKRKTYILGAPEFVSRQAYEDNKARIEDFTGRARRVILFAESDEPPADGKLPQAVTPLALIVISDRIRADAKETLDYFENEQVILKVISGDDPITVSMVAAEAGLKNADRYIDATALDSYEKIEAAVEDYTVFGRVTPYQKIDIVKALKAHDHTVAMTGDGANDVLALKEADCSIAMQSGAEAARNVSNMVLLDSNFESLPLVLAEGRKSINNLQRSASLYLIKTTYSFILALVFIFMVAVHYPFESIQMTLIGGLTIGIPSFFLALEPNYNRIKGRFLFNVFKVAVPTGVLVVAAMLVSIFYSTYTMQATRAEVSTITTMVALVVGFIVVINISGKLNLWKGALFAFIIGLGIAAITVAPGLFSVVPLSGTMWLFVVVVGVIFAAIHLAFLKLLVPHLEARRTLEAKLAYFEKEN